MSISREILDKKASSLEASAQALDDGSAQMTETIEANTKEAKKMRNEAAEIRDAIFILNQNKR